MRILIVLPRLFAALGAICLAIAFWVNQGERRFIAAATRTTGTVVDLVYETSSDHGSAYYPVVRFASPSGDSVTIRSRTGSNPPSHRVGDRIEVLYDPANPAHAKMAGFLSLHIGSFILTIFAAVWGAIGGIWWWLQTRSARLEDELRRSGRRIQAKVREVEVRRNIRVGNRHPWRIIAEAPGTSVDAAVVYKSANIWEDPGLHVGETVDVLVDPYDPKRYVVDLAFLPRKV